MKIEDACPAFLGSPNTAVKLPLRTETHLGAPRTETTSLRGSHPPEQWKRHTEMRNNRVEDTKSNCQHGLYTICRREEFH